MRFVSFKIIFIITPRRDLAFHYYFADKCIVEFSRGGVMCDGARLSVEADMII